MSSEQSVKKCLFKKCYARGCLKNPKEMQPFCQEHWMMLPWQVRRKVNKNLRKNDFIPTLSWDEDISLIIKWLNKTLWKSKVTPPHPASQGEQNHEHPRQQSFEI